MLKMRNKDIINNKSDYSLYDKRVNDKVTKNTQKRK